MNAMAENIHGVEPMVTIPVSEFRQLITDAERCRTLITYIFQNMEDTEYGANVNSFGVVELVRALYPGTYRAWEAEQEAKRAGEDSGEGAE